MCYPILWCWSWFADSRPSVVTAKRKKKKVSALVLQLHHQIFLEVPWWAAGWFLQYWQVLLLHVPDSLHDRNLLQWHTTVANVPVLQASGTPHVHMLTECCCSLMKNWTSAYCKYSTLHQSMSGHSPISLNENCKSLWHMIFFLMYSILAGKWCNTESKSHMNYWALCHIFFPPCKRKDLSSTSRLQ